ncbi:hypothetical protein [Streptomyces mayteni]
MDEAMRAGRALRGRLRRRLTIGGAVAATVVVATAAVIVLPGPDDPAPPIFPADGGWARVVQPYEPVEVDEERVLALVPGGGRYVLSHPDTFEENLRIVTAHEDVLPLLDGIDIGLNVLSAEARYLFDGLYRSDDRITRIVLDTGDAEYEADLYVLPGDPDWGTFYLDTTDLELSGEMSLNAYDADGDLVADHTTTVEDVESVSGD